MEKKGKCNGVNFTIRTLKDDLSIFESSNENAIVSIKNK